MRLTEFTLPKNSWEMLISTADKHEMSPELVDLVKHAYSNTPQGSFVNSIKDVIPSDWRLLDWDKDPDVDATVFYRGPRNGESWIGFKIQGLGHDGQQQSKQKAIAKIQFLLGKSGWWIESSDAMQHILRKLQVPAVTDVGILKALFNSPDIVMNSNDTYTRKLTTGQVITETVFGKPIIK